MERYATAEEISEPTPGPWRIGTREWDGTEYLVIEDATGAIVCQEPVAFYAYPEGPFIDPHGHRANLELIVRLRNAGL